MKAERVIYWSDERNDDFSGNDISTVKVGADFKFVRKSPVWRFFAFIAYYVIAVPLVFLISKLYLGLRFENRKAVKKLGRSGFFLYGNHTRGLDAFIPAMAAFPKKAYIIANPDAVSLPLLKHFVMMIGCLPVPTELDGMRGFLSAVKERYREGCAVGIYPEAHIWPFYTGIRNFGDVSFRYPVEENAPVIAMTTTYRKRKGLFALAKKPAMTIRLSDPMYPDASLPPKAARRELRDRVYGFMVKTVESAEENVEYIKYVKKEL